MASEWPGGLSWERHFSCPQHKDFQHRLQPEMKIWIKVSLLRLLKIIALGGTSRVVLAHLPCPNAWILTYDFMVHSWLVKSSGVQTGYDNPKAIGFFARMRKDWGRRNVCVLSNRCTPATWKGLLFEKWFQQKCPSECLCLLPPSDFTARLLNFASTKDGFFKKNLPVLPTADLKIVIFHCLNCYSALWSRALG